MTLATPLPHIGEPADLLARSVKEALRALYARKQGHISTDTVRRGHELLKGYAFGPTLDNEAMVKALAGQDATLKNWRSESWLFKPGRFAPVFNLRSVLSWLSFPIITVENLDILKRMLGDGRIVEVGCGTGCLGRRLSDAGANIVAQVDAFQWLPHDPFRWLAEDNGVELGDSSEWLRDNPDAYDAVLLSWPYMDPQAVEAWRAMRPGTRLVMVGEGCGGCTADNAFFEETEPYLVEHSFDTFLRWPTVRDHAQLYIKP